MTLGLTVADWVRAFRYDFRTFGRMFVAMAAALFGIPMPWIIARPLDGGVDVSICSPGQSPVFCGFVMRAAGMSELMHALHAGSDVDALHITFPSRTYRDTPEVVVLPRWAVASLTRQLRRLQS